MKKRGHGDALTPDEREDLRRRIKSGEKTAALAKMFNVAERTVCVHRAKIAGTHKHNHTEVACVDTDNSHLAVDRVCWVAGCGTVVTPAEKFCASHTYKAPQVSTRTLARMVGSR